jgi:hypothetical protein
VIRATKNPGMVRRRAINSIVVLEWSRTQSLTPTISGLGLLFSGQEVGESASTDNKDYVINAQQLR